MGQIAAPTASTAEEVDMPAFQLIFNELSINKPAASVDDARVWLEKLYSTAARAIDRGGLQAILLVPESFISSPLTEGYSFNEWLNDQSVERELREALQSLVSWGPHLDDYILEECARIEVKHDDILGLGVTLAVHRDHAVMSVDVHPFQKDNLPVRAYRVSGHDETVVCNFFGPEGIERRLRWLSERACVKPEYEHAMHHDPSSGKFRGGREGMTSIIPEDAAKVYKQAHPTIENRDSSTWWGQNSERYLYRFSVSWTGGKPRAHWSGTTEESNPSKIEDRVIPARIRALFPDRKR
jgi:hypothetical protein